MKAPITSTLYKEPISMVVKSIAANRSGKTYMQSYMTLRDLIQARIEKLSAPILRELNTVPENTPRHRTLQIKLARIRKGYTYD